MSRFTIGYIIFLFLAGFYRIGKLFIYKYKNNGAAAGINYGKSIYRLQLLLYILIYISCALEYFLIMREINLIVVAVGLGIYLFGITFRERAVKSLGKYWSVYIEIKEDHRLIKEGPYRYMRHPNLFCLLLEVNGLALIPNSYYSLLFIWLAYFPLTLYRIYLEEKALIEKFNQAYLDYKREVFALLPLKRVKQKGAVE